MNNILDKKCNLASYEEYLNDFFAVVVSAHGTPTKSTDENLFEKVMSYGRADYEVLEDVKRIF